MNKLINVTTLISGILFTIAVVINVTLGGIVALAITFGVTFYHFAMRLIVGTTINAIAKNKMNYNLWWFRPRKFEQKLYELLKVRKWKKFAPTYAPDTFNMEKRTPEEIAMTTCQAEVVHEVIVVLSFLPILLIIWFGEPLVFIITSILSALIDLIFIILQRFNRPRLVRLIQRMKKNERAQTD